MKTPRNWDEIFIKLDRTEKRWLEKSEFLMIIKSLILKKEELRISRIDYVKLLDKFNRLQCKFDDVKLENKVMHAYIEDDNYFKSVEALKEDVKRLENQLDSYRNLNNKLLQEKKDLKRVLENGKR